MPMGRLKHTFYADTHHCISICTYFKSFDVMFGLGRGRQTLETGIPFHFFALTDFKLTFDSIYEENYNCYDKPCIICI